MRKLVVCSWMLLAGAVLLTPACVELTGQRISWFYDAAHDVLRILIHYDGVHESKTGHRQGAEQIPAFVKAGDVMFLDWWGHIHMAEMRKALAGPDSRKRDLARLVTGIKIEPLGYYREPDGRLGAAQLVTIAGAQGFVQRLNRLLSRSVLEAGDEPELARTQELWRQAARQDHEWVAIDGQSFRATLPVHAAEWARYKNRVISRLVGEVIEEAGEKKKKKREDTRLVIRALTSAPVSYVDEGDRVTLVLGRRDRPVTWRLPMRRHYEPSLEPVVVRCLKIDLDEVVGRAMVGEPPAGGGTVRTTVLAWGPPEERVRALVGLAARGDSRHREAALRQLREWAAVWNRERGVPAAPAVVESPEAYLAAWKKWYVQIRQM